MPNQRTHTSDETQYEELDALVLAEIESLGRPRGQRQVRALAAQDEIEQPARKRGTPVDETALHLARETELEGLVERGEMPDLESEEVPLAADWDEEKTEEETYTTELLSAEEQAFVTRAVGFLVHRDNKDVILGQIWERLAEAAPESFFRPEVVPDSAATTTVVAPAQEGETDSEDGEGEG